VVTQAAACVPLVRHRQHQVHELALSSRDTTVTPAPICR
jgi:hypothetical protein